MPKASGTHAPQIQSQPTGIRTQAGDAVWAAVLAQGLHVTATLRGSIAMASGTWSSMCILAEGAIALSVTLSGGVLFAS